jgi:hypothetical protein
MKTTAPKNGRAGNKAVTHSQRLFDLYEKDEVAWLEKSVALIQEGRLAEMDYQHLAEFLQDMAISQKREVKSRLLQLFIHVLKWLYQPGQRTSSWQRSIRDQRRELELLFETKTLRTHGEAILEETYQRAILETSEETGLKTSKFPKHNPFSLQQWLSTEILKERED